MALPSKYILDPTVSHHFHINLLVHVISCPDHSSLLDGLSACPSVVYSPHSTIVIFLTYTFDHDIMTFFCPTCTNAFPSQQNQIQNLSMPINPQMIWSLATLLNLSPFTVPLTYFVPAMMASLVFTEHTKHTPALGPLTSCSLCWQSSSLANVGTSSDVTFSECLLAIYLEKHHLLRHFFSLGHALLIYIFVYYLFLFHHEGRNFFWFCLLPYPQWPRT